MRAVAATGGARSSITGHATVYSQTCCPPIDPPITRASLSIPNRSVSSRCCARTSSLMVSIGNLAIGCGARVFCGDYDKSLPK